MSRQPAPKYSTAAEALAVCPAGHYVEYVYGEYLVLPYLRYDSYGKGAASADDYDLARPGL
jgi:hypothetical protein